MMPRLIVKVTDDKLNDVVTKLMDNHISFSIIFDEAEQVSKSGAILNQVRKDQQYAMNVQLSKGVNLVGPHPNNKTKNPIHLQAMGKVVLDFVALNFNVTSEDVADHIDTLNYGWKRSSATSTLSSLYRQGKITRVRNGKAFVYNIVKQPELDLRL